MKKIMVRADDLGFSKAINYGIYETLKNGVIRNIGFMVNMPDSLHGYELVKDYDICLGQQTNVCVGKPISDPKDIPTLVNADGTFKTSKMYRSTKEDFVDLDEAILEVEAQYNRFKETIIVFDRFVFIIKLWLNNNDGKSLSIYAKIIKKYITKI